MMKKISDCYLITFPTTTQAMAMEDFSEENQIPGRLIPIPTEISAGCGLSWKIPPEEFPVLKKWIKDKKIGRVSYENIYEAREGTCRLFHPSKEKKEKLIIVRGGGDIATGTIHRLWSAGFRVLVLEISHPAAIRRQVSLCEAVYEGTSTIEGMEGVLIEDPSKALEILDQNKVPVLVDPMGASIETLCPAVVVDAILAKKNLGTSRDMADLTIALGPGFCAGEDVDYVIETKRGHNLGRIITQGYAFPNSGVPGIIGGYGKERVIHASEEGILKNICKIGDVVEQGQVIAVISREDREIPVKASLTGIIRGLIRDGYPVTRGFKIADIDPRKEELANCFTISDKARCIAGSVLELVCKAFTKEEV